jgi:hypothetical protein
LHLVRVPFDMPAMKRFLLHVSLRLVVLVGLLPGLVPKMEAKPDFMASKITSDGKTVLEADVAHFKVWLRNRGDEAADPAQVRIQWPLMGHLVEVRGLENARTDHDAREVTASVSLPAGGERVVEVAVLAPRDSGGRMLSMTAQIIHYHTMAENWVHGSIAIDTRIRTDGVRIGGFRIAPAGLMTLVWLVTMGLAIGMAGLLKGPRHEGRFFGPHAGVTAIMIAIGFWLVFAAMAWRDYRVLREWTEATGTIIGRRIETQTVSSSQRLGSGTTSQSRTSNVSKPEFALLYKVEGREMLSTGYDTGSSLRVGGGRTQLEKEFREWNVGAQVPCWYDPRDPTDVVVKRGFGGAYLFALLPCFPFLIGWWILRGSVSPERRRTLRSGE